MQKIFIIEDDDNIRELLSYALCAGGFSTVGFDSALPFFEAIKKEKPALILLDIMLPEKDGYEILRELRSDFVTSSIPVIMLTAKSAEIDKVRALDGGADDYITKPFGVMELLSRVKALLRRCKTHDETLSYNGIEINPQKRTIFVNGKEILLTCKEFDLLFFLIENHGIVLTRERIMDKVWGFDFEGESRTIDMHIKTLRKKLGESGNMIITVRNVGYKI